MITIKKIKLLFVVIVLSNILFADDFNVDNLLNDIEKKTDLSQKTKLENGGISYIYTRDDITRMQAHNLKDIIKSTYPFGYNENNFGLTDPYAMGIAIPYMSSSLKIYIDNQEITTGLYGSGIVIYGNMDIDFVDHIEVYSGNPTFEFSTEPAFTIIKLYSKVAQKDNGSKIAISGGSRGTSNIMGYTTAQLDNGWSYLTYLNNLNNKRKKYENNGATLSRDMRTTHLFNSIYKNNNKIIVDAIVSKRDSFLDQSLFGSPKDSTIDNKYLHIGYDTKNDNLSFLISFDKSNIETNFEDLNKQTIQGNLPYQAESISKSEVYTTGLNYNININANKLLIGAKYRLKHFKYDTIKLNNIELPRSGHTQQTTATSFIENQYSLADNKIITAGISYSQVRNNHSNQDDNLLGYRAGYTYTNENLISKTTASYLEVTLDPYLVHSLHVDDSKGKINKSEQNIFIQDIKFKQDRDTYEMLASYIVAKNQLMPNEQGLLEAYSKDVSVKSLLGRYTNNYNKYDKLEITLGTNFISNIPNIDKIKEYSATIRNFNSYKKFDFFNELLLYRNDSEKINYYDYSAGVIYHATDDLTFAIKGTNLLDKAKETSYTRLNIQTLQPDTPLKISPIDKKIMLTMEYLF